MVSISASQGADKRFDAVVWGGATHEVFDSLRVYLAFMAMVGPIPATTAFFLVMSGKIAICEQNHKSNLGEF